MHCFPSSSRRQFLHGVAALALATASSPAMAAGSGVLRYRSSFDLEVLDPPLRASSGDSDIIEAIFQRLISFKPGTRWEWELDAAESIEQLDDKHIAFKLRPGQLWTNDYGEMTAEDVKFSFERALEPGLNASYKDDWAALDHVEVVDKYSGIIVLKEYFAPLWWTTLPWHTASILCKRAVEAVGGTFTTTPPATSGPYFIKEWVQKQRIVLARNVNWAGKSSGFDEIHVLPITDSKAAELAFLAHELDYTEIDLSSLGTYKSNLPKDAGLVQKPPLAYVWLGMNTENPTLSDVRVREAIQKAIDVPLILDGAYFGVAERATGIIAPGLLGHRQIEMPPRDLEGAKQLYQQAGDAAPTKLTLDVLNRSDHVSAAQIIQANLADLGIEVQIRTSEGGAFWSLGNETSGDTWKSLQLIYNRFSMAPDPSWATAWFTCDQIGKWNWERWCSKEFSDLHTRAQRERDDTKRDEMYKRMQSLMEESGAYVFITHGVFAALHSTKVKPATLPDGRVKLQLFAPA